MNSEHIRQQQAAGFLNLRFAPVLEDIYQQNRAAMIRLRARLVSVAGLILFLIYAGVDQLTLPTELAKITVTIRLAITCPLIALVVWLAYRPTPSDRQFERIYTLAYLLGGLTVVAIIGAARQLDFALPYEGMILVLMFGYFAMGLPFFSVSLASLVLIISYLLTELWTGTVHPAVLSNLFFLLTANAIGMVGAWSSDYRHRAHFLDRKLLDLMHQATRDESRRKTELITAASHDLRQPLNVIDITLESFFPVHGQADQHPATIQLKDMIRHLRRLLGTVLDSARLNEGMIQPDLQAVSLAPVFRDLGDMMNDAMGRQDVQLRIDQQSGHLKVLADPGLLLRVLQNLVFNAMEHSGGNLVQLYARIRGQQVRVYVSDNGTGAPAALKDTLFLPYVRGHGRNDCPGLGLGLAIVREFTTLMQGRCGMDTGRGQGSTFWVQLPAVITASPGPEPGSHTPSGCEHPAD